MNHHLLLLSAFLLCCSLGGLSAQPGQRPGPDARPPTEAAAGAEHEGRFEQIKRARQDFLSEQLELTQAEAAAFFPLFWHFDREMRAANKGKVIASGRRFAQSPVTEREARLRLEGQLDREARVLEIKRKATAAFLEVLPAVKLIKLEDADREFRRRLLQRVRDRRH